MSKVGDLVIAIEEEIVDAVCANKLIDDVVMGEIADKLGVPVAWVKDAYENVHLNNYGDW
jgi:uncharacterized protein (DUF2126 family)